MSETVASSEIMPPGALRRSTKNRGGGRRSTCRVGLLAVLLAVMARKRAGLGPDDDMSTEDESGMLMPTSRKRRSRFTIADTDSD